jgi:hypothetical protein
MDRMWNGNEQAVLLHVLVLYGLHTSYLLKLKPFPQVPHTSSLALIAALAEISSSTADKSTVLEAKLTAA